MPVNLAGDLRCRVIIIERRTLEPKFSAHLNVAAEGDCVAHSVGVGYGATPEAAVGDALAFARKALGLAEAAVADREGWRFSWMKGL